jgi:hypothetical protein
MALAVYRDACALCPADVFDLRDEITITSRVENEGVSFLTITLPQLCDDFERSLELGFIDSTFFRAFAKDGAIPCLLKGMLSQLFDRKTGRLFDVNADHSTYVYAVRQVCRAFKKMEVPCSPARTIAAIDKFTEVELAFNDFQPDAEARIKFRRTAFALWSRMLRSILPDMLRPKHGPGATAESISGNRKYVWLEWYERLEPFFPFFGTAYAVSAAGEEEAEKVTFMPPELERPVRVVLVPKTLKAPRVIAIEPVCMQYAQQAVSSSLVEAIESYDLTSGHVNFTDQTVNQLQALTSSIDGSKATIDLSDASDRVPRELALEMFDSNPDLRDAIDACRSTHASLPTGQLIGPLNKFASMGSALCFPVESMYFYTICVMASLEFHKLSPTRRNIRKVVKDGIYVYGDDIVVPTNVAGTVLSSLQQYNCKVNVQKTFLTGRFRESCGVDAYYGVQVQPVYVRKVRPESRQQVQELISWVATANLFESKGMYRIASLMFSTCERLLGPLPQLPPDSPGLGRVLSFGSRPTRRWNADLQILEQRVWVPKPVYRSDRIDGYSALQKCLLRTGPVKGPLSVGTPVMLLDLQKGLVPASVDRKHLERTVRRGAVSLKRRWVPAT